MYFVHSENRGSLSTMLVIDPLWILAAWSVDLDGTVDANRFPSVMLQKLNTLYDINYEWNDTLYNECQSLAIFPVAQALSLISYESVNLSDSQPCDKNDPNIFYKWNTRRVWAYGLSNRTSRVASWLSALVWS